MFGCGEDKRQLIDNSHKWRMLNCFDCSSEFGYERKVRINENFYLHEQGFQMTKDVEIRARKIYNHMLEICERHFQKFSISSPPPHLLDYRMC